MSPRECDCPEPPCTCPPRQTTERTYLGAIADAAVATIKNLNDKAEAVIAAARPSDGTP